MSSILIRRANIVSGSTPPVPIDYSTRYLTFEALEAGTFSLSIPADITTSQLTSVSYSTDDGNTWVTTQNDSTDITITTPTIQAGGKVLWKGTAVKYGISGSYSNFSSTGTFIANGNILSLIYGDDFEDKSLATSATYAFYNLFRNCTNVTSIENIIFPAGTANYCYSGMFRGCTAITTAPELPATYVRNYSYQNMFNSCSSLAYIKCLLTSRGTGSTNGWVTGVAASGTFVKDAGTTIGTEWSSGNNGIPSGWTVVDAPST